MRILLKETHSPAMEFAPAGAAIVEAPELSRSANEPVPPQPLTRRGLAWMVLRVIGFLFAAKAAVISGRLIVQVGIIFNIFTVADVIGADPGPRAFRLWLGVMLMGAEILGLVIVAWYFLHKGKAAHSLLMYQP